MPPFIKDLSRIRKRQSIRIFLFTKFGFPFSYAWGTALVYLVPMRVCEMTCRIWRINNTSARWHQRHHSACHSRLSLPPLKISMSVRVRRAAAAHNEILNPFVGTEKKRPVTMPKALGIKRGRLLRWSRSFNSFLHFPWYSLGDEIRTKMLVIESLLSNRAHSHYKNPSPMVSPSSATQRVQFE